MPAHVVDEHYRQLYAAEKQKLQAQTTQAASSQLSGEVTITGIGARPELNDQRARILRFDSEAQRYLVMLGDGSKVKMKAANLISEGDAQAQAAQVQAAQAQARFS